MWSPGSVHCFSTRKADLRLCATHLGSEVGQGGGRGVLQTRGRGVSNVGNGTDLDSMIGFIPTGPFRSHRCLTGLDQENS